MNAAPRPYLTPEQYLARERLAEIKSEYYDGETFAMAGGSEEHSLITVNVTAELLLQLRKRPPTVIVEVLYPTTEAWDRGGIFERYQPMASLQEYVLIAQDRPYVEQVVRQSEREWLLTVTTGLGSVLTLPSIECELPMAEIYRKVAFPEQPGHRREP